MKNYRDEIAMVCHDMMKAGQSVGAVSDEEMREFEKNCFVSTPEPLRDVRIGSGTERIPATV